MQWCMTHRILVNLLLILWDFRRAKEIEEALNSFGFCNWLGILRTLLWLLFQKLLGQTFTRTPLYFGPKDYKFPSVMLKKKSKSIFTSINSEEAALPSGFLQNRLLLINHVICLCQNWIFKIRIRIKEEIKLETLWSITLLGIIILRHLNPRPCDIFEISESFLIMLLNLKL